ncbi:hypothetical protein SAMN02787100_1747 [Chryseobacterium sp. OV279]|nr:hypothetical protein SAMN02787100_1747 [Chryseobacterium sp. OV279]
MQIFHFFNLLYLYLLREYIIFVESQLLRLNPIYYFNYLRLKKSPMKQILFILFMLCSSFFFGQKKCTLKLEASTANLQSKGVVELTVTNVGNKKIKINKTFSPYRMQLKMGNYIADVDCFKDCIKKTTKIKPGQTYTYPIPIKETIQYPKLITGRTYQFHLFFDLIDLTNEDCNIYGLKDEEITYTKVNHD